MFVDVEVCEGRAWRSPVEQGADRFAFVEAEGGDVDEGDHVRCVAAKGSHDLAAVGVADYDRWPVLAVEHLAQPRDVVGECRHRKLRRGDAEAVRLQAFDDCAPAGAIGPGAVDENDVRVTVHVSESLPVGECPVGGLSWSPWPPAR